MTDISAPLPPVPAPPVAPTAAATPAEAEAHAHALDEHVRLYVWQAPVRVTHWLTAGCIVVLSLTGGYIADPFLIPAGGSVMGTVRTIHIVAALLFLMSGIVRTVMLLQGNRFAHWTAFIPLSRHQATELFRQAGFYAFLRSEIPKVLGHNQLAATAYVMLFVLLLVETITGFALNGVLGSAPAAAVFAPLWELIGTQNLRQIHHITMWAILAIALFHVYSCILVDGIEKNGLLTSIFSGYKFPTREEVLEARDGGPELLAAIDHENGAAS
jgi:Ni/Fe-hydrogenase 1 B-type cytochrome subunit